MLEAFKQANDVLAGAVRGISDIIIKPGLINVDFADVKTVMSEKGTAMMGTGTASGPDRARIAAEHAVASKLLEDISLQDAKGVLVNITAGPELSLGEIKAVGDCISDFASEEAIIVTGTVLDDKRGNDLIVTVIATGFDVDQQNEISNTEPEKIVHELGEDNLFSQIKVDENPLEKEVANFEKTDIIEDKIVHVLEDDNCEETPSDEVSVDVEDLNSDEKIIHVLDEFEDEDTESYDLSENSKEDFNESDENEEILDIETPFDMSEDVLNIESPIVDVMDIDVIDPEAVSYTHLTLPTKA